MIFTNEVRDIMKNANDDAASYGKAMISSDFLLIAILKHKSTSFLSIINQYINVSDIIARIEISLGKNTVISRIPKLPLSPEMQNIFSSAEKEAVGLNLNEISIECLFLGMLRNPHSIAGVYLSFFGLTYELVKKELVLNISKNKTCQTATADKTAEPNQSTKNANQCGCGNKKSGNSFAEALGSFVKSATNTIKGVNDIERSKWIDILDAAIEVSKASGISVPSAFIELSIKNKKIIEDVAFRSIRAETINDAIESLMKIGY